MLCDGVTDNGIKYSFYLTGPQGARFELFILPSHTKEQISIAKAQIKREQDVVKFYHIRKTKEEYAEIKLFLHPVSKINDQLNAELLR